MDAIDTTITTIAHTDRFTYSADEQRSVERRARRATRLLAGVMSIIP